MTRNFLDCLNKYAETRPNHIAYCFLSNDLETSTDITYAELKKRVSALALKLQYKGRPGDRALLIYNPGIDFIIAFLSCLHVGIIPIPTSTLMPRRLEPDLARLELISRDAKPSLILTDTISANLLKGGLFKESVRHFLKRMIQRKQTNEDFTLKTLPIFPTDQIAEDTVNFDICLKSEVAYIQYSSGSTGNPKGVMVSHENLIVNIAECVRFLGMNQDSILFSWLPHYHDMGLIGFILNPLTVGGTGILMSPFSFIEDPLRWFRGVSLYQATHTGGPNFAYELCTKWIKRFPQKELDLSGLKVALCGAEQINPATPIRFSEAFKNYGFSPTSFLPVYGLAEHTLIASGAKKDHIPEIRMFDYPNLQAHYVIEKKQNGKRITSCGIPGKDHDIKIMDPLTKKDLGENHLGEIWLKGPSIALGYWGKPDESEEIFRCFTSEGQGPFLRTGDLGFLFEGQLYVFGRIKDIIIIRGKKYAPQDIEFSVQNTHDIIRKGNLAAFSVDIEGVERLVLLAEVSEQKSRTEYLELFNSIIKTISQEYELPVYEIVLIKAKTINKTTSGKIQRYACKQAYLKHELNIVASWRTPALEVEPPAEQSVKSLGEWENKDS